MPIQTLTTKQIEKIDNDKQFRIELARQSFYHFIGIYFNHIFSLKFAPKHEEIINTLDNLDDLYKYISVIGFRGCSKSTLAEIFATWSLVNDRHNFIVYIGNTIDNAKMSLANIKNEIEQNELLRSDFNIVLENQRHKFTDKWTESQVTVRDATIVAKSRGQKIRGAKFKQARIDLIIGDDLEEVKDAETTEKRKKTRKWFFGEVIPATKQGVLSDEVKVVLIGNRVHRDCLIVRFSKSDIVKHIDFPIIDEQGEPTWKSMFPNKEAIEREKEKVMIEGEGLGSIIWAREYLLKDADEEDALIKKSEIQYYPKEWLQRQAISSGVGVDFAISKKETADYTAMVKGVDVKNDEGEKRLLVMPNNVRARLGFEETINKAIELDEIMPKGNKFYPEDVAYQKSAIEIMEKKGLNVIPMKATKDKRARLTSACYYIKTGRVLFPEEGAEDLIENILGFGIEDHDDYADAFSYLVLGMIKKGGGLLFA